MVSVSQNSNSVGANKANKMPSHFPLPGYGNNIRVNAPTCVNKQAPLRILTFTLSTPTRMCQILLARLSSLATTCDLLHSKAHTKKGFHHDLM